MWKMCELWYRLHSSDHICHHFVNRSKSASIPNTRTAASRFYRSGSRSCNVSAELATCILAVSNGTEHSDTAAAACTESGSSADACSATDNPTTDPSEYWHIPNDLFCSVQLNENVVKKCRCYTQVRKLQKLLKIRTVESITQSLTYLFYFKRIVIQCQLWGKEAILSSLRKVLYVGEI